MHLKDTSALLSSQRRRKTAEHFQVAEKLNHAGGISKYKTFKAKQSQSDSWLTEANGGKDMNHYGRVWLKLQFLSSKVEDWSKECKFLTNIVKTFYGKWKFWLLLASFGARFSLGIMPTVWVKLYTITINNNEKLSVACVHVCVTLLDLAMLILQGPHIFLPHCRLHGVIGFWAQFWLKAKANQL